MSSHTLRCWEGGVLGPRGAEGRPRPGWGAGQCRGPSTQTTKGSQAPPLSPCLLLPVQLLLALPRGG